MESVQAMPSISLQQEMQDEGSAMEVDKTTSNIELPIISESETMTISSSCALHEESPSSLPASLSAAAAATLDIEDITKTSRGIQQPKKPRDVSWMTPEERDELAALYLRFSFQNKTISRVYYALTQAGWIYYSGERKYLPPDIVDANRRQRQNSNSNGNGQDNDNNSNNNNNNNNFKFAECLMTANEVAEHLDYYSLEEDLLSDLQIPTNQQQQQHHSHNSNSHAIPSTVPRLLLPGQEERWRNLPHAAVYHFFVTDLQKRGRSQEQENLNNHSQSTTSTAHQHTLETLLPQSPLTPVIFVKPLRKPLFQDLHESAHVPHASKESLTQSLSCFGSHLFQLLTNRSHIDLAIRLVLQSQKLFIRRQNLRSLRHLQQNMKVIGHDTERNHPHPTEPLRQTHPGNKLLLLRLPQNEASIHNA